MDDGDEPSTAGSATVDERPQSSRSRDSQPNTRQPRTTAERYHIGERIGRGGMGEVLVARDEQIGREVAIKRIRMDEPNERAIKRFMREARIQGRLEHPAIVPVHELGRDVDGMPFFAMKKLVGKALSDILEDKDRDPVKHSRQRLLRALADVCLAVELAHVHGVIHRDIKPPNIMLGDFGEVYLLDWGVAKLAGEKDDTAEHDDLRSDGLETRVGMAIGTVGYMAPEQAMGQADIDARADVYALGVVLGDILEAFPDPPPELVALRDRATAEAKENRIATAREVGEAVQRFLDGDRDLELRRRLAREHLEVAQHAMREDKEGIETRRKAMMQAGRALALDPDLSEAGQLITQLIVDPPKEVPPEVRMELERADVEYVRGLARGSLFSFVGYLGLAPGLVFSRSIPYVIATVLAVLLSGVMMWRMARAKHLSLRMTLAVASTNIPIVLIMARLYTPLIATGVAIVLAYSVAINPHLRGRRDSFLTWLGACLLIAIPFLGELVGVFSPTVESRADGALILDGLGMDYGWLSFFMMGPLFVLVLIGVAVMVGHHTRTAGQEIREKFYVQAWQIRHLMPEQRRR
jgi:serine/threonine-protein kinase